MVYGVPWAFGPNPLIYDTTKITKAPDSWGDLWDKKYRGKLSLQDDIATLYMVAQYLGMDDPSDPSKLYNLSDAELAKVKAKMLELKPNVRKYWVTAGDMTQLFQGHEIVAGEGWPLMTDQLRQAKFPAGETIPKEGTTAWADHWVLTKGAKNLDAAYAWLEYSAQPFTQKLLHDVTAYIVANPDAKRYMSPDAGRDPAGDRRLRLQGQLLAVESAAREVPGDLERGEGREMSGAASTRPPDPLLILELPPTSPSALGAFAAVGSASRCPSPPGEFLTLLGASGSGKTTTLRMIAGFEPPTGGDILMDGAPIARLPPFKRDINTVFQQYALFPHMSVRENVGYGLRMRGVPAAERATRVTQALEMVQLAQLGARAPRQLSGGQQQRVALARALVNRPRVLLLDEPLGALDLKLRKEMQLELKHLQTGSWASRSST